MEDKKRKTGSLLASFAIVLLFFMFISVIYGIRYETNDDATISNIASGAYGIDRIHLIYVNVIFGVLLRPLYMLSPSTNWYVIIQLILVIAALSSLIFLFERKSNLITGLCAGVCILIGFGLSIFYSFQYVKCSAILLCTGLLLIFDELGEWSWQSAFGIVFSMAGAWIRWENFIAVGAMFSAILLIKFLGLDNDKKIKAIRVMTVFFAVIILGKVIDVISYRTSDEWKNFTEYNAARMELSDYKIYLFNEETQSIDLLGLNETEYKMIKKWDYWDNDNFPTRRIQNIADSIPSKNILKILKDTVRTSFEITHGQPWRYLFVIILISALLLSFRKHQFISVFSTGIMLVLLLFYLQYRNRFPVRVEVALLFCAVAIWTYCILETGVTINSKQILCMIPLVIIACLSVNTYYEMLEGSKRYNEWRQSEQIYFEKMQEDKDHLYLLSTESINIAAGLDVYHPRNENFYSNIVAYGGWMTNTPDRIKVLEKYGIKDIFIDSVNNPKVYFDYHNIKNVTAYCKWHISNEITAKKTGNNIYAPYQLISE